MPLSKPAFAEFVGTFWLVLGGCGSVILSAKIPELGVGIVGIALSFGLTVLTMAYAIGRISRNRAGKECERVTDARA